MSVGHDMSLGCVTSRAHLLCLRLLYMTLQGIHDMGYSVLQTLLQYKPPLDPRLYRRKLEFSLLRPRESRLRTKPRFFNIPPRGPPPGGFRSISVMLSTFGTARRAHHLHWLNTAMFSSKASRLASMVIVTLDVPISSVLSKICTEHEQTVYG